METAASAIALLPNKGDTAWLIVATAFVMLMSIPGLALFYGGLVRTKNMLSVLMQVFTIFSLVSVLWAVYGYSVAFTEGNAFFGTFDKLFLNGVTPESVAATFSKGVVVPELVYVAFQGAFAAITVGLIVGAFAERVKFSAVLLFAVLWFSFSYLPMAHMVWYWAGPDGYTSAEAAEKLNATAGWLFQKGALDFAGGTVVHINAAIAGLTGAYMVGRRVGLGNVAMAPHSLTMTMIGASLLWFGWFGFNAGSALHADQSAAVVFTTTLAAGATGALGWLALERLRDGHATSLGAASGMVAGLVAITPSCGSLTPVGALVMGAVAGVVCALAVGLKYRFRYDDSLDVVGVHLVGGLVGTIGIGFLASKAAPTGVAGLLDGGGVDQLGRQLVGSGVVLVYAFVASGIIGLVVDKLIGFRIDEEHEISGIDLVVHAETAYDLHATAGSRAAGHSVLAALTHREED